MLLGLTTLPVTKSCLSAQQYLSEAPNDRIPIRWREQRRKLAS
jgi:hypothetical protein